MTARRPSKPWKVILTQNGVQLVEIDHTSEAKALEHVRAALQTGADTARVEYWEDGRWRWFETMKKEDMP